MVLTGESGSVLSLCILVVIYGDKKRYLKITSNNKKDDTKDAQIFFYQESGCLFSSICQKKKDAHEYFWHEIERAAYLSHSD